MPSLFTNLLNFFGDAWRNIATPEVKANWRRAVEGLSREQLAIGWDRTELSCKSPPTAEEFRALCLRPREPEKMHKVEKASNSAVLDDKNTPPVLPHYTVEDNATGEEIGGIPENLKPRPWPFSLEDVKTTGFYDKLRAFQQEETEREFYARKLGYSKCSVASCREWGKVSNKTFFCKEHLILKARGYV